MKNKSLSGKMKLEANLLTYRENFRVINLLARTEEANTANKGAYGVTSLTDAGNAFCR